MAGKNLAPGSGCRLEVGHDASGNRAALRKAADANCNLRAPRRSNSKHRTLQQPCAPARVHKDETAWTVALHLYPWGAAQQIPRETRQDARTGVLWGRRAKRRQPSRPPVKRARHSQVSTDAARPKNTSAAARKKIFDKPPQGRRKAHNLAQGFGRLAIGA